MIKEMIGSGKGLVYALFAAVAAMGCEQGSGPEQEYHAPKDLVEEVCKQQCTCTGCDDSKMQDCVDGGQKRADEADAAGCSEPWDALAQCLYTYPVCDAGLVQVGQCGDELAAADGCIEKFEASQVTCDELNAEFAVVWEACGMDSVALPAGCESASQAKRKCEIDCVMSVKSCDVVNGQDPAAKQVLDDCFASCVPL